MGTAELLKSNFARTHTNRCCDQWATKLQVTYVVSISNLALDLRSLVESTCCSLHKRPNWISECSPRPSQTQTSWLRRKTHMCEICTYDCFSRFLWSCAWVEPTTTKGITPPHKLRMHMGCASPVTNGTYDILSGSDHDTDKDTSVLSSTGFSSKFSKVPDDVFVIAYTCWQFLTF